MAHRVSRSQHRDQRRRANQARAERKAAREARREHERRAVEALVQAKRLERGSVRRVFAGLPARMAHALERFVHVVRRRGARLRRLLRIAQQALVDPLSYHWGTDRGVQLLALLAEMPWVRPPEGFAERAHPFPSLLEYLLAKYPVPHFLLQGADLRYLQGDARWLLATIGAIGRGQSLCDVPELATPLTRRMRHLFLQTPSVCRPVGGLRRAQVLGAGGSTALLHTILRTPLRTYQGPSADHGEPYWHRVIVWLAQWPELEDDQALGVVQWLFHVRYQGRLVHPQGRPRQAVLRHVERFLEDRARRQTASEWAPCGIAGLDESAKSRWSIVEITDGVTLLDEGNAMNHCAWSYQRALRAGERALFSLRHKGVRRATIEVDLQMGTIVQARGKANRELRPEERKAMERWASSRGLPIVLWR